MKVEPTEFSWATSSPRFLAQENSDIEFPLAEMRKKTGGAGSGEKQRTQGALSSPGGDVQWAVSCRGSGRRYGLAMAMLDLSV